MEMQNEVRFQRLGGSCQLVLENAEDFRNAAQLDAAHWIMTSVRTDSLLANKDFLAFLDADSNGRIRVDEVKAALNWMLSVLSDLSGVCKRSDVLYLNSLNENHPDGMNIARTVRIALANLGMPDAECITLAQIKDQTRIISNALQNGDGIIPPGSVAKPVTADCIRGIMAAVGSQTDCSGVAGVGDKEVDEFEGKLKARLAWLNDGEARKEMLNPFGDKTQTVLAAFLCVQEKLDEFFRSCEALSLSGTTTEARLAVKNTLDPMDAVSVKEFLEKSPVAPVNPEGILVLRKMHHPIWSDAIRKLLALLPDAPEEEMTAEYYGKLKAALAPCDAWNKAKPETGLDAWSREQLQKIVDDGILTDIRNLISRDKAVKDNLDKTSMVHKLISFQENMFDFLNNFVTLDRLFDNSKPSMHQAGKLVMDGRFFTLCSIVHNVAEHKKIAANSNICVIYLDATSGLGAAAKTMKLAVGVTSGHMRHFFLGKSGVFYTADGAMWDARIVDMIQQPVSIGEALKMPFYKFADFIQKQADKFFTARSKQFEDTVAKDIQSQAKLPTAPAAPAAKPAPQQTPAFSGSMVLMGGGVGIAAIGSAFAFMAKSIQGISVGAVLAIFFGILLIFGGPIVVVSLTKLFRRNLAIFLEANGNALNAQLRLSLRMGRFFTFTPPLPKQSRIFISNLLKIPHSQEDATVLKRRKVIFYILFVIILLECVALLLLYRYELLEYWRNIF
ncbi:MAG: hypothetical protein IKB16_15555 [Lentisphaeria bacterium]|nr:hypothetical protein [Lentisphaeria bacterium]